MRLGRQWPDHAGSILFPNGCGCCVISLSEMEGFKQGVHICILERHFGRKVDFIGQVSDDSGALPHTPSLALEVHGDGGEAVSR